MRPLRLLLLAGITGESSALLSTEAGVYTLGLRKHERLGSTVPSLSPTNARTYLAQRLGLSGYYNIEDADEATLDILNDEPNGQLPLFSTERAGQESRKRLIIVEGVKDPKDILPVSSKPILTIANPPSPDLNRLLVNDFLCQTQQKEAKDYECKSDSHSVARSLTDASSSDIAFFIYDSTLTDLNDRLEYVQRASAIYNQLSQCDDETTVVLIPSRNSVSKRGLSDWGSSGAAQNLNTVRYAQHETPLAEESIFSIEQKQSDSRKNSASRSSSTPKTTIPSCYPSEEECNITTAGCSGHGSCYKKFTERTHPTSEKEKPECWACQCGATMNGNNTIYWGGPACQKKDLTMPFFLFAGFTVAAVSVVAWGIGLLYSIGSERLPSVLSAGVAVPTARK